MIAHLAKVGWKLHMDIMKNGVKHWNHLLLDRAHCYIKTLVRKTMFFAHVSAPFSAH